MDLLLWVGRNGSYLIPKELQNIRFTKTGWPDRRCKEYQAFIEWMIATDKPANNPEELAS